MEKPAAVCPNTLALDMYTAAELQTRKIIRLEKLQKHVSLFIEWKLVFVYVFGAEYGVFGHIRPSSF